MVELGADVAFEAPELVDECGLVGAYMGGGGERMSLLCSPTAG